MAKMTQREERAKKRAEERQDTFMPLHQTDLADHRFRSELIRMTGTDVIRMSDREFSGRLAQGLVDDYQRQLDEQTSNLAAAEKRRQRQLRIMGIVPEIDMPCDSPSTSGSRKSSRNSRETSTDNPALPFVRRWSDQRKGEN